VAFDRDDTLKKAEKLLRQGRLEAAIVEYARIVEEQPTDWATTNALGDLYVRAGRADQAAAQYGRIAEHFMREGFYQKAAALYKKLLKLKPDDEATHLNLADLSQKQGLLADAKAYLNGVATRRRARGDRAGAAEIVVRLGSLDPGDLDARLAAARMLVEMGDEEGAAARFRGLHADLLEKGREGEALDALREAVRLSPHDHEGRVALAKAAVAAGDLETARACLDREIAGSDPSLMTALLELDLKSGQLDQAREMLPQLLALGADKRHQLVEFAWSLAATDPEAAFVIIDGAADHAAAASEFSDAASLLQEFVTRVPGNVPTLLKLIEVCVDGRLESMMTDAQAGLADAYLSAGAAAEARAVAEDLVAREPWERAHIDRFRRALVMLKEPDPDTLIAERLSGDSPFMVTDPFAEPKPAATDAEAAQPAGETSPSGEEHPGLLAAEDEAASVLDEEMAEDLAEVAVSSGPDRSRAAAGAGDGSPGREPAEEDETLDQVFEDFRDEVSRQSGVDHSAQHLTLAHTYLQMGMAEEAIESLQAASKSPQCRFEAASTLGRVYRDRGETSRAVEWLERAAEAPAPTLEQSRILLYDLGTLVEESGDTARALAIFLELQSEAGNYRDVARRVERLSRLESGG
jgi:tetratricopeptide (TPR) repeat protein